MKANVLASTLNMSKEDWLKARKQGIGGSDAGIILGLSKYKTPFQLYLDKIEEAISDNEESEPAYWGNTLEELVAKEFEKRTGKKVKRKNQLLQSVEYPFMTANLDRVVVGEDAILECKTAGSYMLKEWENDEIPATYLIQCLHYLIVTGCQTAYIAVLIGGQKFIWKEIKRDNELIDMIIKAEKDFWENNVLTQVPPTIDGSEAAEKYINNKFKIANKGTSVDLKAENETKIERLTELKATIKELEAEEKEIENQIKLEIGEAETGYINKYKVDWKQVVSNRVDSKLLKSSYPDIYKSVTKESISRRFSISEIKEEI